jgi:hypothetical protein
MIRRSNCFLAARRTHLPHTAGCPAVICRGHYERMGLDVYVGSLTRYYVGDWLLIAHQVGEQMDMKVTVVRTEPEPADAITDPAAVLDTVLRWLSRLCGALGGAGVGRTRRLAELDRQAGLGRLRRHGLAGCLR